MPNDGDGPVYDWNRQLAVGAAGEARVIAWLLEDGFQVEDVSADSRWRDRDVDVILDGFLMAEIKTDTHAPEKLFVELTVDDKPGYLYKSRADVLLYYYPKSGTLYWVPMAGLAWWVHENANTLQRLQVRSQRKGGRTWVAEGIVVPAVDLKAAGLLKEYHL